MILLMYNKYVCFLLGTTTMANNLLKLFKVLLKYKRQKPTHVLRLLQHINNLHQLQYGIAESKKPLKHNLQ